MNPEFKIGDAVTFKPYEKECKCRVKAIRHGGTGDGMNWGKPDDRIFYVLSGEAISITTGTSIMESSLFEPWTEEKAKTFFRT